MAETKKINVIFLWPTNGLERGVTERDVLKLREQMSDRNLELSFVKVNTLDEALRVIDKGNVAQYFHKGNIPANAYNHLGGFKF